MPVLARWFLLRLPAPPSIVSECSRNGQCAANTLFVPQRQTLLHVCTVPPAAVLCARLPLVASGRTAEQGAARASVCSSGMQPDSKIQQDGKISDGRVPFENPRERCVSSARPPFACWGSRATQRHDSFLYISRLNFCELKEVSFATKTDFRLERFLISTGWRHSGQMPLELGGLILQTDTTHDMQKQ